MQPEAEIMGVWGQLPRKHKSVVICFYDPFRSHLVLIFRNLAKMVAWVLCLVIVNFWNLLHL